MEDLGSWEEEGGSVVLMGALVMGFVDVKDLREALSDTEHHLVCVNCSLMIGNVLCLHKAAIIVLIYSPCHKRFAVSWFGSREQTSPAYTSCQKIARGHKITAGAQHNRESYTEGFGRSIEIFRAANVERRFVECGIIFQ